MGRFTPVGGDFQLVDEGGTHFQVGHRSCPNEGCHCHLFVVVQNGRLIASYPPERIDFDASGIPAKLVEPLHEAISCHACGCFKAAAMMVRKCLEAMCEERGATGGNLYQRIQSLKGKVILPTGRPRKIQSVN